MSVLVSHNHRVLQLTLNRPEKRNALNSEMCLMLVREIEGAQARADIGCILVSACGSVFCSGMDLDEAIGPSEECLTAAHEALFSVGGRSHKPIIMCVNGAALGGGLGLVAQGHIVVAGSGAVFGLPEIHIGLWPFLVYRSVEAALGPRRTLQLSLTGKPFHAHEAFEWGLVQQLCPPAEAQDRAKAAAREVAKASPAAIAAGMRYFQESRGKSWNESGQLAAELRDELMRGADFKEGVLAFKQKRDPRWPSLPNAS